MSETFRKFCLLAARMHDQKALKDICFQLREAMSLFVSKTVVQGCYQFCKWLLSSTASTRLAVLKLDRATPALTFLLTTAKLSLLAF